MRGPAFIGFRGDAAVLNELVKKGLLVAYDNEDEEGPLAAVARVV